jgi:tetratricopeptide (TPR) repeat protein
LVLTWENKSRVPDIYFAWSEDFDYRSYVERKSHFDEVSLAVDQSAMDVVGSVDRLSSKIGIAARVVSGGLDKIDGTIERGMDKLDDRLGDIDGTLKGIDSRLDNIDNTLTDGFTTLSFDLGNIDASIHDLSSVCELGFSKVAAHTARSNELLEDLVGLIKSQDQTWAREQYDLARDCIGRELWEDALGYADKAIHGNERNSGLHIEPVFHFLKGDILLNYPEVGEGLTFVERALESYLAGAKYCANQNHSLKALCLLQASWCYYCLGNRDEAIEAAKASTKLDTNPLALFHLAKYTAYQTNGCLSKPLVQAVLGDDTFFVRASNDRDFLHGKVDLDATADRALETRKEQLKRYRTKEIASEGAKKLVDLAQKINVKGASPEISKLTSINSSMAKLEQTDSLAELNDFFTEDLGAFRTEADRWAFEFSRDAIALREKINSHATDLRTAAETKRNSVKQLQVKAESISDYAYDGRSWLLSLGFTVVGTIIAFFIWSSVIWGTVGHWRFWSIGPTINER